MRAEHLRPLLVSFFDWVKQAQAVVTGRNLVTSALTYAFNQEKELLRVIDDGRLPLDNTRSERSLRKIVVGRKAWMSRWLKSAKIIAAHEMSLVS